MSLPNTTVPGATPMMMCCDDYKLCCADAIHSSTTSDVFSTAFGGFSRTKVQIVYPQVLCVRSKIVFTWGFFTFMETGLIYRDLDAILNGAPVNSVPGP